MNALYLKDLAHKTRRGLEGRIRQGKSGGGRCFGYDIVHSVDRASEPVHGERRINQIEAVVVRRIFEEFAKGHSPRAIAGNPQQGGFFRSRQQDLGRFHDLWQLAARHGHSQQRTIYRSTGLEPSAICQGSTHR